MGLNYDNANRRTCLTLPNEVVASYGYDNDSHVTSITYGTSGNCSSLPSNLGNLTYTYDASGRRTATAGSLAAVTLPANVAGGTSTTYNADNEQSKFNGTALSYDLNGNLLSDGTNTYTWDARNHLTAIDGGTTSSFVYDGFGRRMKRTVSGTMTQFFATNYTYQPFGATTVGGAANGNSNHRPLVAQPNLDRTWSITIWSNYKICDQV